MKLTRAISSSSSSVKSDHLEPIKFSSLKGFVFLLVSSILIGSFSSSSFSSKLLLLYFIKVSATGHPVAEIFVEYTKHCVF